MAKPRYARNEREADKAQDQPDLFLVALVKALARDAAKRDNALERSVNKLSQADTGEKP